MLTVLIQWVHSMPWDNKGRNQISWGLRITIDFKCSISAKKFLEDESRWNDWFKWLGRANQHDVRYERIAWLKILDVPLEFWDEENFSLNASC